MTAPDTLAALSREAWLAMVAGLQRQVAEWTARNEALRAALAQLKRRDKR